MIVMREIGIKGLGGGAGIEPRNEVGAPDAAQALLDVAAFLGLVPEEVLALGELFAWRLGAEDGLQRVRVVARVPGLGGDGHRRGGEVLHLLQMEVEALGDDGKLGHILLATAGVGGDEVGDYLLAQVLLAVDAVELALEVVKLLERGLAHQLEHAVAGVLGRHLQLAAHVAGDQLACILAGNAVGLFILTFI